MRTFLTLLLTLLTIATSRAQTQQHSIEIDASSFTPVQTDALSGVAIDKIGKDHSQRECARIKMRISRMTAAEIGELSVRPRGGNVEVMKCVVASEGNGLIIELTAKEPTRFYLSHPKHGDSNEVSLNLAGGKEYTLSAELNVVYPIFVNTNIIGAEVYIDDVYVGSTNSNYTLMAKEVKPGRHKLRLQHGSSSTEREIEVTSDNLDFRIEINTATSRPQYVIFEVMPKNASVVIDQKSFAPKDGIVTTTLNNGSYSYVISAKDYHEERGTFVVNGAKVDKVIELSPAFGWVSITSIGTLSNADIYIDDNHVGKTPVTSYKLPSGTHRVKIVKELYLPNEEDILIKDNEVLKFEPKLTADFAIVTLTTDKEADIYIDNTLVGRGTWTGNIASGAHIFEARKQGHRTTVLTQTITTTPQNQSYNLGSPTPIMGILDITSLPAKADVYVDNKLVGQTPIMVELIIGQHSVSVRKEGYRNSKSTTINIAEDEVCNMDVTLEKGKTYGDVRITGRPITANVTINGEDRGTTPLNTKLESGTYTVKLSAKGYKPYTKELEITEAKNYFVDGLLEERQGGFESILDITTIFTLKDQVMLGVDYIAGYRFNNHIYMGCGIGLNGSIAGKNHGKFIIYNTPTDLPRSGVNMPLYGYLKWDILDRNVTPFIACAAGVNFALNNKAYSEYGSFRYKVASPMLNPQFGLNCRISTKSSFWFAIGFNTCSTPTYLENNLYSVTLQNRLRGGLDLHIGFTF